MVERRVWDAEVQSSNLCTPTLYKMLIKKKFKVLDYFQEGNEPKLLIHSGTHGDELDVIPFVGASVEKYLNSLSDFVYIPKVSPSAAKLKTRLNKNGIDLNRNFLSGASDEESVANMEFHGKYKFNLCVDFHEDPELADFYMYDSGKLPDRILLEVQKAITSASIELFNGVDDPNDPALGFKFENGYRSFENEDLGEMDGTFWGWFRANNEGGRIIVIEIPGKLEKEKKEELVEIIFEKLILHLV